MVKVESLNLDWTTGTTIYEAFSHYGKVHYIVEFLTGKETGGWVARIELDGEKLVAQSSIEKRFQYSWRAKNWCERQGKVVKAAVHFAPDLAISVPR